MADVVVVPEFYGDGATLPPTWVRIQGWRIVSVKLRSGLLRALDRLAELEGSTRGEVIRRAILFYIAWKYNNVYNRLGEGRGLDREGLGPG